MPTVTNKKKSDPLEVAAAAAVIDPGQAAVAQEAQKLLIDQLNKRLAKETAEEEAAREKLLDHKRRSALKLEQQAQQFRLEQSNCTHQKQDGRTRVAGQRLSNGHTRLACMWCQKVWEHGPDGAPLTAEDSIPRHLLPNGDFIGSSM